MSRTNGLKPTAGNVGINQIGRWTTEMATFCGKDKPETFTSHCIRRSAATWLAESGASLPMMKIAGGWSSSSVAESYIARSKRTMVQLATALEMPVSKAGPEITVAAEKENSSAASNEISPTKRTKQLIEGVANVSIGQQLTFGSVQNCTFYFGWPPVPPAPTAPPAPVAPAEPPAKTAEKKAEDPPLVFKLKK